MIELYNTSTLATGQMHRCPCSNPIVPVFRVSHRAIAISRQIAWGYLREQKLYRKMKANLSENGTSENVRISYAVITVNGQETRAGETGRVRYYSEPNWSGSAEMVWTPGELLSKNWDSSSNTLVAPTLEKIQGTSSGDIVFRYSGDGLERSTDVSRRAPGSGLMRTPMLFSSDTNLFGWDPLFSVNQPFNRSSNPPLPNETANSATEVRHSGTHTEAKQRDLTPRLREESKIDYTAEVTQSFTDPITLDELKTAVAEAATAAMGEFDPLNHSTGTSLITETIKGDGTRTALFGNVSGLSSKDAAAALEQQCQIRFEMIAPASFSGTAKVEYVSRTIPINFNPHDGSYSRGAASTEVVQTLSVSLSRTDDFYDSTYGDQPRRWRWLSDAVTMPPPEANNILQWSAFKLDPPGA